MDPHEAKHAKLVREHRPEAIRERLRKPRNPSILGDAVLGAIDGGVTSFAIVSAAVGGGFSSNSVVILGFANVLADGLSMAISNLQAKRSEAQLIQRARRHEDRHITLVPEGEREEVRQIYAAKGFEGEALEHVVAVITADRERWIETMLTEELGLPQQAPNPIRSGLSTFVAFALAGTIPLLPYAIPFFGPEARFPASAIGTAMMFLAVGYWKGREVEAPRLRSALATLALGGGAAGIAYFVGFALRQAYGS